MTDVPRYYNREPALQPVADAAEAAGIELDRVWHYTHDDPDYTYGIGNWPTQNNTLGEDMDAITDAVPVTEWDVKLVIADQDRDEDELVMVVNLNLPTVELNGDVEGWTVEHDGVHGDADDTRADILTLRNSNHELTVTERENGTYGVSIIRISTHSHIVNGVVETKQDAIRDARILLNTFRDDT